MVQLNVGDRFALFRFPTDDGRWNWLKATGEPNTHELAVTSYLSKACATHLPELIAIKKRVECVANVHRARPLDILPAEPVRLSTLLENVLVSLAEVQMATVGVSLAFFDLTTTVRKTRGWKACVNAMSPA